MSDRGHFAGFAFLLAALGLWVVWSADHWSTPPAPSRPASPAGSLLSPVVSAWVAGTLAHSGQAVPEGRVYFVALREPNASDSNNGLYPTHLGDGDGPWLTLGHAANRWPCMGGSTP